MFKAPLEFPDRVTVGKRIVRTSPQDFEQHFVVVSHASGRVVATGRGTCTNYSYLEGRPVPFSEEMEARLFAET